MSVENETYAQSVMNLYTDGACSGNPGPGGLAFIIEMENSEPLIKWSGVHAYTLTTNNRMEILAVTLGLKYILSKMNELSAENKVPNRINIYTDSKYVCDSVNFKWLDKWLQNNWTTVKQEPVKNMDLWQELLAIFDVFKNHPIVIKFNHISGHAGHPQNEECDKLAVEATKANDKEQDVVYEDSTKYAR